jgi:hypothetical protein
MTILIAIVCVAMLIVVGIGFGYLHFMKSGLAEISPVVAYVIGAVFIVIFTVMMSQYRFHAVEASRMAQYQLGFMRVLVAGRRAKYPGYQSEVRVALTQGAFDIATQQGLLSRRETRVESPVPGHAASDISARLLEKLIESVEVTIKK